MTNKKDLSAWMEKYVLQGPFSTWEEAVTASRLLWEGKTSQVLREYGLGANAAQGIFDLGTGASCDPPCPACEMAGNSMHSFNSCDRCIVPEATGATCRESWLAWVARESTEEMFTLIGQVEEYLKQGK